MSPLLETKLHRPPAPRRRVRRPRLSRKLGEGRRAGRPITLVSAPAGSGKTTVVGEWLEDLDLPVGWLTLDAGDDDPGRFYTYLVAALQRAEPAIGVELAGVLRAGQLPPPDVVCATLVHDLVAAGRPVVLVLDDLHVIRDPTIHGVLGELVAHLPEVLELILVTREDPPLPLDRLRAHNRLTEVRAADLRFDAAEAGELLNDALGLALGADAVAALTERTEGWGVGLQLAALSIREHDDPARFIASLRGSHRHILGYLTEEVLARQPAAIQAFLLQTAVLDRLCGELCDAVTGRDDGAETLAWLLRANLFLIPLDDEGRWYRYHHLFADLLRDRRAASGEGSDTVALHRRASAWYAAQVMPEDAIEHALAAGDHAGAVALLEEHVMDLFMRWQVQAVQRWMAEIPREWTDRSLKTTMAFAWMHLIFGELTEAAPYLSRLEALLGPDGIADPDPSVLGQWRSIQASMLTAQGQAEAALALARPALDDVPPEDHLVRGYLRSAIARAHEALGQDGEAEEAYRRIIEHGRAAGDTVTELLGISGLGLLGLARGRLRMVFEVASQGVRRMEERGELSPIGGAVLGELGEVYYQWMQLDEALRHFDRSAEITRLSGFSDSEMYRRVVLSRIRLMAGDPEGALPPIEAAVRAMRADAPAQVPQQVRAQQARVLLALDRAADAEAVLLELGVAAGDEEPGAAAGTPLTMERAELDDAGLRIALHRARAARDRSALRRIVGRATALIAEADDHGAAKAAQRLRLLRARVLQLLGDEPAARADLDRALRDAEPEGVLALFVEEGPELEQLVQQRVDGAGGDDRVRSHAVRVLEAFAAAAALPAGGPEPAAGLPAGPPPEALSAREREVLAEMAKGLKYREIAARLGVSLNTVRSHVKSIYGKLGVDNRTRALVVARRHGLV